MKKIICQVLTLCICLGLFAGCGSSEDDNITTISTSTETTTAEIAITTVETTTDTAEKITNSKYVTKQLQELSFKYNSTYTLSEKEDGVFTIDFTPQEFITIVENTISNFSNELKDVTVQTTHNIFVSSFDILSKKETTTDINGKSAITTIGVLSKGEKIFSVAVLSFACSDHCYTILFVGSETNKLLEFLNSIEFN